MLNCDCTDHCRSSTHGDIITSAITKRSISDADLCSYLSYICYRCESVSDPMGRNALHLAASCGRSDLLRWLVVNRNADVSAKDKESGCTALHRSIFYGKIHCAVELLKLGAPLTVTDCDGLMPIEHAMKDGLKPICSNGEMYFFGSNNNNIYGTHESKKYPSLFDTFHKKYPKEIVCKICMDKYHLIIQTVGGNVYSCGHGRGGRLGLNYEGSVTTPQMIKFSKQKIQIVCLQASLSMDHSIFLCQGETIYTCGSNTFRVLGHAPPPDQLLYPKELPALSKEVVGVIACQYHSVAWGPDCLYAWGLNVGQLGKKMTEDHFLINPRKLQVFKDPNLKIVSASNGATCFYTVRGDVYVLTEYNCKKIGSKVLNLVQISVIGGKLNSSILPNEMHKKHETELKVAALTNTGNVLVWQQNDQQLIRCVYNLKRAIVVKQIFLNAKEILMTTDHGEVFAGGIKPRKKKPVDSPKGKNEEKSAFHKFLERDDCLSVSLHKFPRTHRAVYIQSDPKGEDYGIIQEHPYKMVDEFYDDRRLKFFLEDLLRDTLVSDITLKVGNQRFFVHRFILASKCSYFRELLLENPVDFLELNEYVPCIFEQFLKYVYSDGCDLIKVGEEVKDVCLRELCLTKEKSKSGNLKNPVRLLHELAKKLQCHPLQDILGSLTMDGYFVVPTKGAVVQMNPTRLVLDRNSLPEFSDVIIECSGKRQLKAHKCILGGRVTYFRNMFSSRWNEDTPKVTLPFPSNVVEILLDYLYSDSLSQVESLLDTEQIVQALVLADHLFIKGLKEKCELVLSSMLTLKNAAYTLTIAGMYNADNLAYSCRSFITANLAAFLELGYLNDLDEEALRKLSEYYYASNENLWKRQITPYSTAASDETVRSISSLLPKALLEEVVPKTVQKKKSRVRRSGSPRRHNLSVSESDEDSKPQTEVASPTVGKKLEFVREDEVLTGTSPGFDYVSDFPEIRNNGGDQKKSHKLKVWFPPKRERLLSQSSDLSMSPPSSRQTIDLEPKGSPWKTLEPIQCASPKESFRIDKIMSEEKQQKQNWFKISNKLLQHTQMEDQAIAELDSFYNVGEVTDEIILIERVQVATTVEIPWIPTNVR